MQYWRFVQRGSCEGALLAPILHINGSLAGTRRADHDMWILTFSGCQSTEHAALLSARGFSLYTLIWSMFRMYECWCLVTNEDIMYLLVRAYVSASSSKLF